MPSSTFVTEPAPGAPPAPSRTAVVQGHRLAKRFGTGTSAVDALEALTNAAK